MDYTKAIIDTIIEMSGKYSPYEIFSDWIKCSSLAISNQTDLFRGEVWQQRERDYMTTMKRYSEEEQQGMSDLFELLALALTQDITDVLGTVYMQVDMGSKSTGQFFTPFYVTKMTTGIAMPEHIDPEKPFLINEPSAGGGGMLIASAKAIKEKGVNFQKVMRVVAQDLDWKGVYMTYLQLSLLGIKATVVQGDTLHEPFNARHYPKERILYTPAQKGMLL